MPMHLRRWVGTHPVLVVNLATLVLAPAAGLGLAAVAVVLDNHGLLSSIAAALVVALTVPWLVVAAPAAAVTVVLVRAGLPASRVLGALKWTPVLAIVQRLVANAIVGQIRGDFGHTMDTEEFVLALVIAVFYMSAQSAGCGLGVLWSRWRGRGGRWEITQLERPAGPQAMWTARHPAAALLIGGTAIWTVFGLLYLFLWVVQFAQPFARRTGGAVWPLVVAAVGLALAMLALGWTIVARTRRAGRSTRWAWLAIAALMPLGVAAVWFPTRAMAAVAEFNMDWSLFQAYLVAPFAAGSVALAGGGLVAEARNRLAERARARRDAALERAAPQADLNTQGDA